MGAKLITAPPHPLRCTKRARFEEDTVAKPITEPLRPLRCMEGVNLGGVVCCDAFVKSIEENGLHVSRNIL